MTRTDTRNAEQRRAAMYAIRAIARRTVDTGAADSADVVGDTARWTIDDDPDAGYLREIVAYAIIDLANVAGMAARDVAHDLIDDVDVLDVPPPARPRTPDPMTCPACGHDTLTEGVTNEVRCGCGYVGLLDAAGRPEQSFSGTSGGRPPASITVDGLRYTRADITVDSAPERAIDVYVALTDAQADVDDLPDWTRAPDGAVYARAFMRDVATGVRGAIYEQTADGTVIDADQGPDVEVTDYVWRVGNPRGVQVDAATADVLDRALADVEQAWEHWQAADAAMGDPYP